jgi:beta-lactam-binding protein with PASTA domain
MAYISKPISESICSPVEDGKINRPSASTESEHPRHQPHKGLYLFRKLITFRTVTRTGCCTNLSESAKVDLEEQNHPIESTPPAEQAHHIELLEEHPQLRLPAPPKPWYFRRRLWIPLGLLGVLIALFLVMNDVVMPFYVKSGKSAIVPNIVGLSQKIAVQKLSDAGYEPVQYEVRFDEKAAEGTIIRQTPEAGEETKPGRKVYLIISGGKELVVVPDLHARSLRDAKMMLLKENLSIGTTTFAYSDSAANGTIYSQTPAPGIKISTATKVNLVISQGPTLGRVPVPDLRKMTLKEAIEKINAQKLSVGNVSFQSSPTGEPNTVIEQYPTPGDLVTENSNIDLFVIRGKSEP